MTTWYTSDWHFGHKNILHYCATFRPYDSVEEMNEGLVDIWNTYVATDDTVVVIGDVCMGKLDETLAYVARLHGTKVLIPGNHDAMHPTHKAGHTEEGRADQVARYLGAGFTDVWDLEVTELLPEPVLLCHFPYEGDHSKEARYLDHRPADEGLPLVHGHVHDEWVYRGRQMNVGFDAWGRPVHEDEVVRFVRRFT